MMLLVRSLNYWLNKLQVSKKGKAKVLKLVPVEDREQHESRIDSMRGHPTSHKPRPTLRLASPSAQSD